jgi:hypothetical protein
MLIRELFSRSIDRRIEEVIKVDQTDEAILREELEEYVVTRSIKKSYLEIFEEYAERPNKPSDAVGVWVSGFFGSGKSSFAKNVGLALSRRAVGETNALDLLSQRINDNKATALLKKIEEQIPTDGVIFDVSTDRGVVGNQTLTEIMYRSFLEHLGYSRDLDIAELEISLEQDGRLDEFLTAYGETYPDKDWDVQKNRPAFALGEASRVMNVLDPSTYPEVDSWKAGARQRADVSPGHLADRCKELMERRRDGQTLVFVVDEVGQFVARDVQKMLDLQGIVQSLGRVGRGKMWLVVTSQEKLTELVGGLDGQQVELARLMDRFPLQVHLEPSDISEVTSRRVLAKSADGAQQLRELFGREQGRLETHTRVRADVQLPPLTPDSFAELYPLLPYQVNLIIDVVSGLRTQGGASRHVGGANRTIIKLAQQLLVHPEVALAEEPLGALATLDRIYDLVSGNIPTELRAKIQSIPNDVDHPLAAPVAKAVCLLQFVQNIPATKENLAAVLHPSIDAESRLAEVEAALDALENARKVRQGDRGYRIPSPVEDDWETQRSQIRARPGDIIRIQAKTLEDLWAPQPNHMFMDAKAFKAGLVFGGKTLVEGDLAVHVVLADPDRVADETEQARGRSHTEKSGLFWVAEVDENLARDLEELYRSDEMLSRRAHATQGKSEATLAADERRRRQKSQEEVRRRLKEALLAGSVFFRGNDRSPSGGTRELRPAVEDLLERVLPEVFHRFAEGAAKVKGKDLEELLTAENLHGLPAVFSDLKLVVTKGGQDVFNTESGPLAEILARVKNRADYGDPTSGKSLAEEFGREPFGWDFDVVRLMTACLLRAGAVEMRSQNNTIESARTLEAKNVLTNNNKFRQATFRPRTNGPDAGLLIDASAYFEQIFGKEVRELEAGAIATELRSEMGPIADRVGRMITTLNTENLPGQDALLAVKNLAAELQSVQDSRAISVFVTGHKALEHGLDRLQELEEYLHDAALEQLRAARRAVTVEWPALEADGMTETALKDAADAIADILAKETFYKELPALNSATAQIQTAFNGRYEEAVERQRKTYEAALEKLAQSPAWKDLDDATQQEIAAPLRTRAMYSGRTAPLAMVRETILASPGLLQNALERVIRSGGGGSGPEILVISDLIKGAITSEEQLETVLNEIRDHCLRSIADGTPVILA